MDNENNDGTHIEMSRLVEIARDTTNIHLVCQISPPTPGFDLFRTKLELCNWLKANDGYLCMVFKTAGIEWMLISVSACHFDSIESLAANCGLRFAPPPEIIAVFSGASAVYDSDEDQAPLGCIVNWIPFPICGETLLSVLCLDKPEEASVPTIIQREHHKIEMLLREASGIDRAYI